jgi:hypothetical protein
VDPLEEPHVEVIGQLVLREMPHGLTDLANNCALLLTIWASLKML